MAKYNIYGHVLYSEIQYEQLMYETEKIFIRGLMAKLPSIDTWTDDIWNNIDHEYMIQTLEEIKKDVIERDTRSFFKYNKTKTKITSEIIKNILLSTNKFKNIYEISQIVDFKKQERIFAKNIEKAYKKRVKTIEKEYIDEMTYLTEQIKNFSELEGTKVYANGRHVSPSTYLSMLYNVNLTRTGWNQTFKDAAYFEKDLMILETHPRSCPLCAAMQGKLYSRTGKSDKYPSMEVAYENGVGHPNCKCEWSIYWRPEQLELQKLGETKPGEYELDQKRKVIEREIRKQEQDLNLYNMIGNQEEVDKTLQKIDRLKSKL